MLCGVMPQKCSKETGTSDRPVGSTESHQNLEKYEQQFALDLFKEIANKKLDKGENICISPFSIYNLLTLLAEADSGYIHHDILRLLAGPEANEQQLINRLKRIYNTVEQNNKMFTGSDPEEVCLLSNSLWYNPAFTLVANYKSYLSKFPHTRVFAINPSGKAGQDSINRWAAGATKNLIPHLLPASLSGIDALLVNTLYFKGQWIDEFQKRDNKELCFRNINRSLIRTTFMTATRKTGYYEDDYIQILNLYLGHHYIMRFYLPREGVSVKKLLKQLSVTRLKDLTKKLTIYEVYMEIPKFKQKGDFSIFDIIRDLTGSEYHTLNKIFYEDCPMLVDIRQAFSMDVNENGVEAAAVSYAMMVTEAFPEPVNYPKAEFKLNRPFFYTIELPETSTFLFMGAVTDL